MVFWRGAATAFFLILSAASAEAATRRATPETLEKVLTAAKPGDTVVLERGDYPILRFGRQAYRPALTIDARAATATNWRLGYVDGLIIQGGTFRLPPPVPNAKNGRTDFGQALRLDRMANLKITGARFIGPAVNDPGIEPIYGEGYGIFIVGATDVEISDNLLQGFKSGMVLTRVDGFQLLNNEFRLMRSDGMQVAESHKGRIESNRCMATHIRDLEHPDCIQMWSRPTSPPTADILIRKNSMEGVTQGIGLFNHKREGVDDGGFDRILVEDNDINVAFPQAIGLMSGRDSIVRNNRIRTFPGAKYRASINTGPGVLRCGNKVAAGGDRPSDNDKACSK